MSETAKEAQIGLLQEALAEYPTIVRKVYFSAHANRHECDCCAWIAEWTRGWGKRQAQANAALHVSGYRAHE